MNGVGGQVCSADEAFLADQHRLNPLRTAERMLRTVRLRSEMTTTDMGPNGSGSGGVEVTEGGRQAFRANDDAVIQSDCLT